MLLQTYGKSIFRWVFLLSPWCTSLAIGWHAFSLREGSKGDPELGKEDMSLNHMKNNTNHCLGLKRQCSETMLCCDFKYVCQCTCGVGTWEENGTRLGEAVSTHSFKKNNHGRTQELTATTGFLTGTRLPEGSTPTLATLIAKNQTILTTHRENRVSQVISQQC